MHTGNAVIADYPVFTEKFHDSFLKSLEPFKDKMVVKIECPVEIAEQKGVERGDRALGIAKRQFDTIHNYLRYDLAVDCTTRRPKEIANVIFDFIRCAN